MMKDKICTFLSFLVLCGFSFVVFTAVAGSVKWEMTNTYPNSGGGESYGTTTTTHLGVGTTDDSCRAFGEMIETRRRIDILWTDYTNRMERISKMRQKRKEKSETKTNVPPKSPLRFVKPSKTGRSVK